MEIKSLYLLHGILQIVAFLILFPIGILIAIFKNYIGAYWFISHILFQSFGIICVFTAVLVMIYAKSLQNIKDTNPTPTTNTNTTTNMHTQNSPSLHAIIGFIIIALIIIQVIWAVFVRKIINHDLWAKIHLVLAILIIDSEILSNSKSSLFSIP